MYFQATKLYSFKGVRVLEGVPMISPCVFVQRRPCRFVQQAADNLIREKGGLFKVICRASHKPTTNITYILFSNNSSLSIISQCTPITASLTFSLLVVIDTYNSCVPLCPHYFLCDKQGQENVIIIGHVSHFILSIVFD